MNAQDLAAKGDAGKVRSRKRTESPPLLGRKSVLMGILTSGFVIANARQPSADAAVVVGTIKPIAATLPAYVTRWVPSTVYANGQQVISPCNDVVAANVSHTSSTNYATDKAKWSLSSTFESGATCVVYVAPNGSDANDGRTKGKPKLTVRGALSALAGVPGVIEVGAGTITEVATWGTVPAGTTIRGAGKAATGILHAFNGDLGALGANVKIQDLTINGQGSSYTGRCFSISNGAGFQKMNDVALNAWDGYCIEFAFDSGSQFAASGLDAFRVGAGTGTGRYAIKISDTQQLAAVPRSFTDFQSQGTCAIDFGGCNDTFVVSSFIADLRYTPDTRGVNIVGSRLANQLALTVSGHNNSITGCDICPQVTIAPGADAITIGPGSYNNLPVLDTSGNNRNLIHHWSLDYRPTFSSGGTAPALGNGTLSGVWSRSGSQVTASVNFTVGSTTTLGSGGLQFGLPFKRSSGDVIYPGTARISDVSASTGYFAVAQIPGNVAYVTLIRDTTGAVTYNSPVALTAGDTISVSVTYLV